MNHRFSKEEEDFLRSEIAEGDKIISTEESFGQKSFCIRTKTAVQVGNALGLVAAIGFLVFTLSRNHEHDSRWLVATTIIQKVFGISGHSFGFMAARVEKLSVTIVAITLEVLEMVLCVVRLILLTDIDLRHFIDFFDVFTTIVALLYGLLIINFEMAHGHELRRHQEQSTNHLGEKK